MSRNRRFDRPSGNNDQEDIRWFENYEKRNEISRLKSLRNKDILNYIKDIERNCRLEVSSGDEDYAGTKRSSICSVRCSDVGSPKKVKSRITSKRNKNITYLERKVQRSIDHNNMYAYNYRFSSGKSRFRSNPVLNIRENSNDLNTSVRSTYRYPKSSSKRGSYKYRESSPRFYGSYSRKYNKTSPAITETTNLEIIKGLSRDGIPDSRINRSQITNGRTARDRTFKPSLLGEKRIGEQTCMNIYPSVTLNETAKRRDLYYRTHKQKENTRSKELSEESDVNDLDSREPFNKLYPSRNEADELTAIHRRNLSRDKGQGYNNDYSYRVRRPQISQGWSSLSNRLTAPARSLDSLSRTRTPLEAYSTIMATSIDRNYRQRRESKYKNNTNQRREGKSLDALEKRGSSCCCKPDLLTESGKLCKVIRTREDKQWLDCCCEDVEQDETADCSRYCHCPEDANDPVRRNYQMSRANAPRAFGASKRVNCIKDKTALRETRSESVQSRDNDGGELEFYKTKREDLQSRTSVTFDRSDVSDDIATSNNDRLKSGDLKSRVSFPDDWPRRTRREHKISSSDLKINRGAATETPRSLRDGIIKGYAPGEKFHREIRASRKLASGDSTRLRYKVEESLCECAEPFHDPPAACLIGSCTCTGHDEDAKNDGLSSQVESIAYCCCSSPSVANDEDPVRKLESFCERVKAVNQDVSCRASRSNNARRYLYDDSDERNRFAIGDRRTVRNASPIAREWLTDPDRLRHGKIGRGDRGTSSLEKILIYPPRGERGPPLTLYKRSSNINCRVKGNADAGFRYTVTYVQKFVSPTWLSSTSPKGDPKRETDEENERGCDCPADYG